MTKSFELMEFAHTWLLRLGVDIEDWHRSLGRTKERYEMAAPDVLCSRVLERNGNSRILSLEIRDDRSLTPASLRIFEQSFDGFVPGLYVRLSVSEDKGGARPCLRLFLENGCLRARARRLVYQSACRYPRGLLRANS